MTDINTLEEDDFTEVRKANVPRLDLVGSPAGGTKYLIMKAHAEGLLAPEAVERLLKGEDDPTLDETLIEPGGAAGAAASVPASPEWEQVDADSAANAYGVLARVSNTLEVLAEREAVEAATSDGSIDDNVWALEDAQAAVEFAMDTVAVYAASEELEANPIEKAAAAIIKATSGLGDALTTVESYGSIRKAGRTLSAANESKLRSASDQITSVLASLPAAPDEMKKEAAPVADTKAEQAITKSDPAAEIEPVVKADAEAAAGLEAVFDANGNLKGVVDPSAIQPVSGASKTGDDDTADDPAPDAEPGADQAPDEVGTPTDEVAKSVNIDDLIKAAADEVRAETAELVKGLTKEIEFLKAPAPSRAFTNGATGVPVTRDGEVLKSELNDVDALIKASEDAPDSAARAHIDNLRTTKARELLMSSRPTA